MLEVLKGIGVESWSKQLRWGIKKPCWMLIAHRNFFDWDLTLWSRRKRNNAFLMSGKLFYGTAAPWSGIFFLFLQTPFVLFTPDKSDNLQWESGGRRQSSLNSKKKELQGCTLNCVDQNLKMYPKAKIRFKTESSCPSTSLRVYLKRWDAKLRSCAGSLRLWI